MITLHNTASSRLALAIITAVLFLSQDAYATVPAYNLPAGTEAAKTALEMEIEMAEAGNAPEQHLLGWRYYVGDGVPRNVLQAAFWYRKAAEQGYAAAQVELAELYLYGLEGMDVDVPEAMHWYRQAAEQGRADAQLQLGHAYLYRQEPMKDKQAAYFWLLLSAAQGNRHAQRSLPSLKKMLTAKQRKQIEADVNAWKPLE
ncbi:tetratricopeptide repeat protein [Undibacterium sp. JH2W]|uniref:tetratricopeptide repeat protein n=1 Tax=Undibacterium sp. JH2W TaxID=3413037 RepID=UPI003BF06B01